MSSATKKPQFELETEKFRSISQLSYVAYDTVEPPRHASIRRERLLMEAAALRQHSPPFCARSNSELSYAEGPLVGRTRVHSMKPPHRLGIQSKFTANSTSRESYADIPADVLNEQVRAKRNFETITTLPFTAVPESRRNFVWHKVKRCVRGKEVHRPLRNVKFDAVSTQRESYK
jgi:hypothetical protein